MSATATSKESYKKLEDLGPRQIAVHKAIGEMGTASNREIAGYLDKPVNEITPRVKELRDFGLVKEFGKKWDRDTKRNVTAWCVTDPYAERKIKIIQSEEWRPAATSWLDD